MIPEMKIMAHVSRKGGLTDPSWRAGHVLGTSRLRNFDQRNTVEITEEREMRCEKEKSKKCLIISNLKESLPLPRRSPVIRHGQIMPMRYPIRIMD